MSTDNRFKPPAAVVDDVGVAASRTPMILLALVGLLQLGWFASRSVAMVSLVSTGAANPMGLLLVLGGEACLAVALLLAAWRQRRPQKTFVAAVVLLAGSVWWWRSLPFFFLGWFVLGTAIAAIGWTLGRARVPTAPPAG